MKNPTVKSDYKIRALVAKNLVVLNLEYTGVKS